MDRHRSAQWTAFTVIVKTQSVVWIRVGLTRTARFRLVTAGESDVAALLWSSATFPGFIATRKAALTAFPSCFSDAAGFLRLAARKVLRAAVICRVAICLRAREKQTECQQ